MPKPKPKPKPIRHWLIAAFEPFAARKENNSMHVQNEIKKLESELLAGESESSWNFKFHYIVLPVEYKRCFSVLDTEIKSLAKQKLKLEGVLALGEGAEEFKMETQGHNLDDVAELADNAGETRANQKIIADFPVDMQFPLRFPFEAFSRIRSSKNAGFYICNHLCTEMSYHYSKNDELPYFGFIHVPKTGSGGMFTPDVCAAVIVNGFKKLE
jgi:pyrrolidone-carboxylate peptidase